MRTIDLQGVTNVRDLGGIPACGDRAVTPGLFFRGGNLSKATPSDLDMLFTKLGIGCVIDVRCGWERDAKPDTLPPGIEYLHIPFYDLDIVGIEYTTPAPGTKPVGRDFACEPLKLYRSLANPLTVRQMQLGVNAAFNRALQNMPVYIHCSGGKDRAGILALLILTALGVSREDILEDYLLTNVARDKDCDGMLERFLRFTDGDVQFARELTEAHRALPENLDAFYSAIDEQYGNMDAFMRNQLALDDERLALVQRACTVDMKRAKREAPFWPAHE